MTKPSKKVITDHCTRSGATVQQAKTWAGFLHGLDWNLVKPLVQLAVNTNMHPALAAGMVANRTSDEQTKATITAHLEAKRLELQDTRTQEAEDAAVTGPRCQNCQCCLAAECASGACGTNGTGPQWCPCAETTDEQAHSDAKAEEARDDA